MNNISPLIDESVVTIQNFLFVIKILTKMGIFLYKRNILLDVIEWLYWNYISLVENLVNVM